MASDGLRLEHRFVMDIPMVTREAHRTVHTHCDSCNSLHRIPLRTLAKAAGHRTSQHRAQIPADVAAMDAELARLAYDDFLPELAFLGLTGALRPGHSPHPPLVAWLPAIRAAVYARAHGPSPHLDRLTRIHDPRTIHAADIAAILTAAPRAPDLDAHVRRMREAHPHA